MIEQSSFNNLASVLQNIGEKTEKNFGVSQFVMHEISELTLILSKVREEWIPDGISFELFGSDFFLMPDGTVTITEKVPNQDDKVYTINESLIPVISSFLLWRIKVLEKMSV